jgi:hypothetical protein
MTDYKLNYGTKPTTVAMTSIEVKIDSTVMVGDYADAYANELHRLNPVRAKELNLSKDDLLTYFSGLIAIRIQSINGTLRDWRTAKRLSIPAWIQHTLSQLGEVVDRDRGLRITPSYDEEYEMAFLLAVSEKLQAFESDGLSLHIDAFPRDNTGNEEVMGMVIVNDYVHSMKVDSHPASSYVAAFLGAKLVQEQQFSVLYRVRYDDVNFIATQLINDRSLRL